MSRGSQRKRKRREREQGTGVRQRVETAPIAEKPHTKTRDEIADVDEHKDPTPVPSFSPGDTPELQIIYDENLIPIKAIVHVKDLPADNNEQHDEDAGENLVRE